MRRLGVSFSHDRSLRCYIPVQSTSRHNHLSTIHCNVCMQTWHEVFPELEADSNHDTLSYVHVKLPYFHIFIGLHAPALCALYALVSPYDTYAGPQWRPLPMTPAFKALSSITAT